MRNALSALLLISFSCSQAPPPARYALSEKTAGDVPLILLEDAEAGVQADIAPAKGGELCGLRVRVKGAWVETIYLADDYSPRDDFGGKAPLLWPAVGRSLPAADQTDKERGLGGGAPGGWIFDGRRYPMTGHGFARDYPWQIMAQGADDSGAYLKLRFVDRPDTRERYPFGFALSVTYRLAEGALAIDYQVHAAPDNEQPMPFSIGNHITFKIPLVTGSAVAQTTFVTPSKTRLLKDDFGFPNGQTEPRSHADGISLDQWEPKVPISLTGYEGEPWVELRDPQGITIRLEQHASKTPPPPYIQFNVWGDPNGGYFSPEPWMGMQNSLNSGQGLIELAPGETLDWTIRVEPQVTK